MVLFEPGGQLRGDFDTSRLCHDLGEPGGTLHVAFPPAPPSYVPTKSFSRSKKPFSSFVGVPDSDPNASTSFSTASRCAAFIFFGTRTVRRTCWSPLPRPSRREMPFPLSVKTRPAAVPGGTSKLASPWSVGTRSVPPSAAKWNGTAQVRTTSKPSRRNCSCDATDTNTCLLYTSPS